MSETVTLTTSYQIEGESLTLRYEVVNDDEQDVYLLNRLYRTDKSTGELIVHPDIVYVELDPRLRRVEISKRIPDLHSQRFVPAPVCPFVTPVRAGATFVEKVVMPLPLRQYFEPGYGPEGEPKPPVTKTYDQVSFVLGFYWSIAGVVEDVQMHGGQETVVPRFPAGQRPKFGRLISNEQMKITVMQE